MERNIASWVDKVCGKFDALRVEVEENMNEGPVRFVEDQVKTVGTRVKKFYSDIIKDLEDSTDEEILPHSPKEIFCFKKLYSELIDLVGDDVRVEPQDNISRTILNGDCIVTPDFENTNGDSELLLSGDVESESDSEEEGLVKEEEEEENNKLRKKDSLFKKLYSEVKKELSELVVDVGPEERRGNINRMILNGDFIITPDFVNIDGGREVLSKEDRIALLDLSVVDVPVQSQTNINRMILNGGDSIITPEFEKTDGDNELLSGYDRVTQPTDTSANDNVLKKAQANIDTMILNSDSIAITSDIENTDSGKELLSRDDRVAKADLSESSRAKQEDPREMTVGIIDSSEKIPYQSEASSIPRDESEACESSQTTSIGLNNLQDRPTRLESGSTASAAEEEEEVYCQQGMMMTRLGESCVLVDKPEQVPASYVQVDEPELVPVSYAQGQQQPRSYKKKLRDVLYRRVWAKKNKKIGVEPAVFVSGEVKYEADTTTSAVEPVKTTKLRTEDDSEWELI